MRTSKGDEVRVRLGARGATIAARDRVRELLRDAASTDGPILFDAARLTFISRTAAAELLDSVRRWRAEGRTVAWCSVDDDVAKMLRAVDPSVTIEG